VEDHQPEDIMVSLRKMFSPGDFSAVCQLEDVDYGNAVYLEAFLEKIHKDANEIVDPCYSYKQITETCPKFGSGANNFVQQMLSYRYAGCGEWSRH
jgi:hypothetical protein